MTKPGGSTSRARHVAARTQRGQRDQQRENTRRRLIEAAVTCFARDGYVGARVEDIAAEAGTSRATFYLHFRSKVDVVRSVMTDLQHQSIEMYRELDDLVNPTWAALHTWVTSTVELWDRHKADFLVVTEAMTVEPDLAHIYMTGINDIASVMSHHLDRWTDRSRDTALLRASMFTLQLERFCYFWKVRGEPFDAEQALNALTDALWLALHPPQH